jgi:hypothetical protein
MFHQPLYSKTVQHALEFNGKTHLVNVKIEAFEDSQIIEEELEILAGLESGEYVNCALTVTASFASIEGNDSLGCVILSGGSTFQSELEVMVNENGMIENALAELTENLNDILKVLT